MVGSGVRVRVLQEGVSFVPESKWDLNRSIIGSGELELNLPIQPVSLQANRRKKDAITFAVRNITKHYEFILTDDVQVDIEWWIHTQDRYELDSSADVDNIIKPLLDALCGPDGILFDDCQVQSVQCGWLDHTIDTQNVVLRVKNLDRNAWLLKEGLIFVHMWKGLCYPLLFHGYEPKITLKIIEQMEFMLSSRDEMLERTGSYHHARMLMSCQRIFHISRVQDFPILQLSEVKSGLQHMINQQSSVQASVE